MEISKIIIESDDINFINNSGICIDSILRATEAAINRIKSINSQGVNFIEQFADKDLEYILYGELFYYKRKREYRLMIDGIGEVKAKLDKKSGQITRFNK